MGKPTVYLAGQITGLTYGEATGWREYVSKELAKDGIKCYSPMRAKEFLEGKGKLLATFDPGDNPCSTAKGITTRDRWDCTNADIVFMNLLGMDKISVGCCIELGWADMARVPIVLAMEDNGIHEHMMVQDIAGFRVKSLEQGMDVIRGLFTHRGDDAVHS